MEDVSQTGRGPCSLQEDGVRGRMPEVTMSPSSDACSSWISKLTFVVAADPATLVSTSIASAAFADLLSPQAAQVPFLLAGPVSLTVACRSLPSIWQPNGLDYPNLEIWLPTLIEFLAGADRLLVSAFHVTGITVATQTSRVDLNQLSILVSFRPDQSLDKSDLRLVEFPGGWCHSLPTAVAPGLVPDHAEALSGKLAGLVGAGNHHYDPLLNHGFLQRRLLAQDIPVVSLDRVLEDSGRPSNELLPAGTES